MSAANQGFGSMRHLAARFFDSLRPGGPPPGDEAWARSQLLPGEEALWVRMSGPDRRHAVGVARDAIVDLGSDGATADFGHDGAAAGPGPDGANGGFRPEGDPPVARPVVAAALLHDVGKIESGLGTWARAGVTIVSMVAGRARVAAWSPLPTGPDQVGGSAPGRGRRRAGGGVRAAAGRYVTHDQVGASLLREAGSDPFTVAWAAEHHQPETAWTLDRRLADALKAADGD